MSATLETDCCKLTDVHKVPEEFIVVCLLMICMNNVLDSLVINYILKVEKAKIDFKCALNKFILRAYYVPGIGDTAVVHTDKFITHPSAQNL